MQSSCPWAVLSWIKVLAVLLQVRRVKEAFKNNKNTNPSAEGSECKVSLVVWILSAKLHFTAVLEFS